MARSARLFLCARCRDQVLLCSHCDRGQRYCSRACSSTVRGERRREAAARYQGSRRGRLKHAARSACWRQRQRGQRSADALGAADKVTHQGCCEEGAQAPLLACDTPSTCAITPIATLDADRVDDSAPASADAPRSAVLVCRRCAVRLRPHVRQGWLGASRVRWHNRHDHPG